MTLRYSVKTFLLYLVFSWLFQSTAYANHKPVFEFGMMAGGITVPQYEGSRERYNIPIIWPYFVYRGDNLRVDRAGVRKTFFNTDRASMDLGFSIDLPVYSENVEVRKGMPDILFMGQIGPRLNYELNPDKNKLFKYLLRLPVRGVIDIKGRYSGLFAEPNLVTSFNIFRNRVTSYLILGAIFTSSDYNRIFYDVDEKNSRPNRPVFMSGSGLHSVYVKFVSVFSLTRTLTLGAYIKWRDLGVGVISESPLIEKRTNYSSGLILLWSFWGSSERATHERLVDQADEDNL